MESLVSTRWLAEQLGARDLRVIDASAFLPNSGRDGAAEYEAEHIPGAVFLDLDAAVDPSNPLPHSFPPAHVFASKMRALGIGDGDRIVVYDNSPLHSAARAWWMLRAFGARRVAVLDGGLETWKADGRPLASERPARGHGHFTLVAVEGAVVDKEFMLGVVGSSNVEIVDARPGARFRGENAEPRAGLAAGHIPGSRSLSQSALFEADGTWKRGEALRAAFQAAGVDLSRPLVATCGSGVTACVLLLGAHLLGKEDMTLYDGSWSEWGGDPDTPKATGAA
jgi:thiosulfate/3-mercaptopyruvate sulfurtransferase